MFFSKTPQIVQSLFPNLTWRINTTQPIIYLTFDDGPIPVCTEFVLDELAKWDAKATFFCVGENVRKYPFLFHKVINQGHAIGNHTYNHLSGWDTDSINYYRNIRKGAHLVQSNLFRPPYGKIKRHQIGFLKRYYKIIMWDVLSGDYDDRFSGEDCINHVINNVRSGSIVVFHDSIKSMPRLKEALPEVLRILSERGFRFEALMNQSFEKTQRKSA